jgi:hypothetical protein
MKKTLTAGLIVGGGIGAAMMFGTAPQAKADNTVTIDPGPINVLPIIVPITVNATIIVNITSNSPGANPSPQIQSGSADPLASLGGLIPGLGGGGSSGLLGGLGGLIASPTPATAVAPVTPAVCTPKKGKQCPMPQAPVPTAPDAVPIPEPAPRVQTIVNHVPPPPADEPPPPPIQVQDVSWHFGPPPPPINELPPPDAPAPDAPPPADDAPPPPA